MSTPAPRLTQTRQPDATAWPAVLVGGLLATTAVNPAAAQPLPDPRDGAVEAHRGSSAVSDIPDVAIAPPGEGMVTSREDSPVAPGVNYTSFRPPRRPRLAARRLPRRRPRQARRHRRLPQPRHGLRPRGTQPAGRPQGRDRRRQRRLLRHQRHRRPARHRYRAGRRRRRRPVRQRARGRHNETAVIGKDGLGRIAQVFLQGTATDDDASKVDLTNLNSPTVNANGIGLYTPQWGDAARTRDGRRPSDGPRGRTPRRRRRLLDHHARHDAAGRERARTDRPRRRRDRAPAFELGDKVDVKYGPRADAADVAVGQRQHPAGPRRPDPRTSTTPPCTRAPRSASPRTAAGWCCSPSTAGWSTPAA